MHGLWASMLVVAGFLLMLRTVGKISRRLGSGPETKRKAVHLGTGLVSLSFPWLFPSPLWFLAAMGSMLGVLMTLRLLPSQQRRDAVLHGVERQSLGDVCFLVSIVVLYFLSRGEPVLYVIPLAVMTLSDALAAMVGTRHGRRAYPTHDGVKSWEGTAVCLGSAFVVTLSLLWSLAGLPFIPALLIALNLAAVAAIVEGISWNGLDNLLLPLTIYFLLDGFLILQVADVPAVVGLASLVVLGIVGIMAAATVRLGALRADAAMAATVFMYVFWAVGGIPVLAVMLIWFAAYAALARTLTWPFIDAVDGRLVAFLCAPASVWALLTTNDLLAEDSFMFASAILGPATAAVMAGMLKHYGARSKS
ncbi:MAG: diacylglycerol/polyprenol kinase family protein [Alphaproteobacteria bacterium]